MFSSRCKILEVLNDDIILVSTKVKSRNLNDVFSYESKIKVSDGKPKDEIKEWIEYHEGLNGYFRYDIEKWAKVTGLGYSIGRLSFIGELGIEYL